MLGFRSGQQACGLIFYPEGKLYRDFKFASLGRYSESSNLKKMVTDHQFLELNSPTQNTMQK